MKKLIFILCFIPLSMYGQKTGILTGTSAGESPSISFVDWQAIPICHNCKLNEKDTIYFIVSFIAQNNNVTTYGDMPVMVVDGDYINRKKIIESEDLKKYSNVIIINIIKLTKKEYLTYSK